MDISEMDWGMTVLRRCGGAAWCRLEDLVGWELMWNVRSVVLRGGVKL